MKKRSNFTTFSILVESMARRRCPDHNVTVKIGRLPSDVMAETQYGTSLDDREVTVVFNNKFKWASFNQIERAARHEILHILLRRASTHLECWYSEKYADDITHDVIARLEGVCL